MLTIIQTRQKNHRQIFTLPPCRTNEIKTGFYADTIIDQANIEIGTAQTMCTLVIVGGARNFICPVFDGGNNILNKSKIIVIILDDEAFDAGCTIHLAHSKPSLHRGLADYVSPVLGEGMSHLQHILECPRF